MNIYIFEKLSFLDIYSKKFLLIIENRKRKNNLKFEELENEMKKFIENFD